MHAPHTLHTPHHTRITHHKLTTLHTHTTPHTHTLYTHHTPYTHHTIHSPNTIHTPHYTYSTHHTHTTPYTPHTILYMLCPSLSPRENFTCSLTESGEHSLHCLLGCCPYLLLIGTVVKLHGVLRYLPQFLLEKPCWRDPGVSWQCADTKTSPQTLEMIRGTQQGFNSLPTPTPSRFYPWNCWYIWSF